MQAAGSYIVLCLAHRRAPGIDPAPVKTVVAEFGVDTRTAQRWKEQALSSGGPWIDVDLQERFVFARAAMRAAAKQYPRFGGMAVSAMRQRAKGDSR